MINNKERNVSEAYRAPEALVLSLEGGAICETSFTGGDIKPGEGFDWGNL